MDDKSRWRGRYGLWLLSTALLSGCQLPARPSSLQTGPTTPATPLAFGAGTSSSYATGGAPRQTPQVLSDPGAAQLPAVNVATGAALPPSPVPVSTAPVQQVPMQPAQISIAQVQPAQMTASPIAVQAPPSTITQVGYPPPPIPLLQPGVNVTPLPTSPPSARGGQPTVTIVDVGTNGDVHQLPTPTASGAILGLAPGDHPIERAAIVTQQLRQEQSDKKALEAREQQLKTELALREKSLREATYEVKEATEEIRKTRAALQATLQESDDKMAALRKREQADVATIKEILKKLDHPAEGPAAPTPGPGSGPAPAAGDHAPMRP